jgi:serine/threonine-protein kinase RsbW
LDLFKGIIQEQMITVQFPGEYNSLALIAEHIREIARDAGLDEYAIYAVETAVDEACTNIIEHGYGGEGIGEIGCTCSIGNDRLTIVLNDHGQPFNPQKARSPKLSSELKKRSGHGLGIYLMRKCMDEIHYDYSPKEGNTLTLVKYKIPCQHANP